MAGLRSRSFELVPFEDSIAFRIVFEEEFRRRWAAGYEVASKSLLLQLRADDASSLPADYLAEASQVTLSHAKLREHQPKTFERIHRSELKAAI